jgi:hypothetical protein
MKHLPKLLTLLTSALFLGTNAFAAPAKFAIKDSSIPTLMPAANAQKIWTTNLSPKVAKAYPMKKWGYISEVNGGFDGSKTCVVVARAMVVPLAGKNFIYNPKKTSSTLGTLAGATPEQCAELATNKLTEAVQSVLVL